MGACRGGGSAAAGAGTPEGRGTGGNAFKGGGGGGSAPGGGFLGDSASLIVELPELARKPLAVLRVIDTHVGAVRGDLGELPRLDLRFEAAHDRPRLHEGHDNILLGAVIEGIEVARGAEVGR